MQLIVPFTLSLPVSDGDAPSLVPFSRQCCSFVFLLFFFKGGLYKCESPGGGGPLTLHPPLISLLLTQLLVMKPMWLVSLN